MSGTEYWYSVRCPRPSECAFDLRRLGTPIIYMAERKIYEFWVAPVGLPGML